MAFIKRTWLARIGTGLNKFLIGAPDGDGKQTLTNSPDSVTQQGDVISADNLNDLEDRIYNAVDDLENTKQDTLTFDNAPTQDSNNPVKSGGVYNALAQIKSSEILETIPTSVDTFTSQTKTYNLDKAPNAILITFNCFRGLEPFILPVTNKNFDAHRIVFYVPENGTPSIQEETRGVKADYQNGVLSIVFDIGYYAISTSPVTIHSDNSRFIPYQIIALY